MAGRRIALVCAGEEVIGEHVATVAKGLKDAGDRVVVVAPSGFAARFGLDEAGVRFTTLEVPPVPELVGDATATWNLRAMLRGGAGRGPDVVHAFGTRAGLAAALSKVNSAPLVVTWWRELAEPGTGWADRLRDQPVRLIARRGDVALCATTDLVSAVLRLGSRDARHVDVPIAETVAAGGSASATEPVEQLDALYRELTGR